MTPRIAPFVALAVVVGAGGFALLRSGDTPAATLSTVESPVSVSPVIPELPITESPAGLPPGHPPIGQASPHATGAPSSDETPALAWRAPPGWQTAPNPNAMRLATYRPADDSSDAPEISVTRAGGTTEANIQRWLDQFDNRGIEKRTQVAVHGLDVTVVEVSGNYMGGSMMPGSQTPSHPGWTLVGAIVPTSGSAYFFKLLGPAAKVRAARASFDALVGSAAPR